MISAGAEKNRWSTAFTLYLIVLVWLGIGIISYADGRHLVAFLIYVGSFLITWRYLSMFRHIPFRMPFGNLPPAILKSVKQVLLFGSVSFIILHWFWLGGLPVLHAIFTRDYYEIVMIRQSVTENMHWFWNYGASMLLRAVIPFLMLYGYVRRERWTPWLILLGFTYSLSLMQKSYVVVIYLPLIVYGLSKKRWSHLLGLVLLQITGIVLLMLATNPGYRPNIWTHLTPEIEFERQKDRRFKTDRPQLVLPSEAVAKMLALAKSAGDRVIMVPGRVVGQWFDLIPEEIPYAKGCGYRFLAPILGCTHKNMPMIIYKQLYPELSQEGIVGTINAASFMEDYSNFGLPGLILAGIILAVVLSMIGWALQENQTIELALNIVPVLYLSSVSLTTTLLSGGWVLIILFYVAFRFEINRTSPQQPLQGK
jgi:hypothetical protein